MTSLWVWSIAVISCIICSNSNQEETLDAVLEHHQNMQEKIAEEMIQMAQNLKHNSLVASNVLKKDNQVLSAFHSFFRILV